MEHRECFFNIYKAIKAWEDFVPIEQDGEWAETTNRFEFRCKTVEETKLHSILLFKKPYCLNFFISACLRIQVNDDNKSEFSHISPERAFADFLFAHAVLHLVVANFLG